MGLKKNWDILRNEKPEDSVRHRDVYNKQQMSRGKPQEKISPKSRQIISVIIGIMIFLLSWFAFSVAQFGYFKFVTYRTEKYQKVYYERLLESKGDLSHSVFNDTIFIKNKPITYVKKEKSYNEKGQPEDRYYYLDNKGHKSKDYWLNKSDVPVPEWFLNQKAKLQQKINEQIESKVITDQKLKDRIHLIESKGNLGYWMLKLSFWKIFVTLSVALGVFALVYQVFMKNLAAQNLQAESDDINQFENDQHIQLPEEIQRNYDWFPDVGAESSVSLSSIISHVALTNKGINKIQVSKRYDKDIKLDDDEMLYKGDYVRDENDHLIFENKPMFDEKFANDLFDSAKALENDLVRKFYDATNIPYNPGNKNREKLKGFDTVADLINKDWTFPYYERQRPAGAYIVDTAPVNTMV